MIRLLFVIDYLMTVGGGWVALGLIGVALIKLYQGAGGESVALIVVALLVGLICIIVGGVARAIAVGLVVKGVNDD